MHKISFNELTEKQKKEVMEKGYSITCDNTNNSKEDIENGIIKVEFVMQVSQEEAERLLS